MSGGRESARRSRMRKQRHLDELRSHVVHLRSMHTHLIKRLNEAIEGRDRTLRENVELCKEAYDLLSTLWALKQAMPAFMDLL
ncbi:Light-inducible protein CPRF2 [Acorus calamus]|uniref:Light-inducible protein CPRF2 n=1 Tax=Acorus calamus TaxID=4465 RepID=A0AAV9D487_ACOCL|nr:Light-inducible protein CPRF2 [Acorus calamus]